MIIGINSNQEVVFSADGAIQGEADNKSTFHVDSKPEVEVGKVLCFNPETKTFYHKDRPPVDEESVKERQAKLAERRAAEQKKNAALKWLEENDWKINKHTLGEWGDTDERWIAYLDGRQKAREDYDEAVAALKN